MRVSWTAAVVIGLVFLGSGVAAAKVDLVTLPKRDTVQLTIYNAADLTLAREERALTLTRGTNRLEFSWANTLIDPTSLEICPKARASEIDVLDLAYPPRSRNAGIWSIESRVGDTVPMEISYLTSGLSWRAFYMGTLSPDEATMHLQGYVRVTNNSGEDYEDARIRVVVGRINLVDEIAELARREAPYGQPSPSGEFANLAGAAEPQRYEERAPMVMRMMDSIPAAPKRIEKEALSEYFLYTIEGTETIPNGWSKRLPASEAESVPVSNLYKYDERRFGEQVIRFLSFSNDTAHNLGETPLPGGTLRVYRKLDGTSAGLSYEGRSQFKYIPVNEEVELNLGPARQVIVEPTLMNILSEHYLFDEKGNITGWDEVHTFSIEVRNTRNLPVTVEIRRHVNAPSWELEPTGDYGEYEKVDSDTVRFSLNLQAEEKKDFGYILTTHHGRRAD